MKFNSRDNNHDDYDTADTVDFYIDVDDDNDEILDDNHDLNDDDDDFRSRFSI